MEVKPAISGKTSVNLPPFGEILAKTHLHPFLLKVNLERISTPGLKDIAENANNKTDLISTFEKSFQEAVKSWIVRMLVIGAAAGAFSTMLRGRFDYRKVIFGGLIGLITIGAFQFSMIRSYDYLAFKQPKFKGMLSAAPWLMNAFQKKLDSFGTYKKQVRYMAKNVSTFQDKIDKWSMLQLDSPEITKVLFISDMHNNPAGLDLAGKTIKDFNIDFVIDAGDITDYGTELETQTLDKIKQFEIPYLFVSGNHDSEVVKNALAGIENVKILDNKLILQNGMGVYGVEDPGANSGTITTLENEEAEKFDKILYGAVKNLPQKPDVMVVHNPDYAKKASKTVKVTLSGHTHKENIEINGDKAIINAGSVGGAGIRGISGENQMPFSYKILYFDKNKLVAVDSISFLSVNQEFNLQRNVINPRSLNLQSSSSKTTAKYSPSS